MEKQILHLKDKNYRLITPPQSGEAFENHDIAFLLGSNGINIELIDTDTKADIIG
jgi:hypothetical protein